MTDLTAPAPATAARRPLAASFALAVVTASVAASILCLGVATIALAVGASPDMMALTPGIFVPFVVIGVIGGAVGWTIVRAKSGNPRRLLTILVPVVLGVSLVPDVMVGVSRALPGTTWTSVIALMVMHVVVAACAVAAYRVFLPVSSPRAARSV